MAHLDYARMEKAIAFLDRHAAEQPPLGTVARHVGLSPFHFSRLFRQWAGLSPKRFLEVLTARRARTALRETPNLLDAALESGLSGSGRLHDLSVTIHAMTPAELRAGGAGLEIRTGVHPTPFGDCLAAATGRGICWLAFLPSTGRQSALKELRNEWPGATFRNDPGATRDRIREAFQPDASSVGPLHVHGTNFQIKVWEALLRIPSGRTTSYGELAAAVGNPKASRATGSAVGRNPIAFLIPCHRAIRATGVVGAYRWGTHRKQSLLAWELAHGYAR